MIPKRKIVYIVTSVFSQVSYSSLPPLLISRITVVRVK